jgi:hypothetical protein
MPDSLLIRNSMMTGLLRGKSINAIKLDGYYQITLPRYAVGRRARNLDRKCQAPGVSAMTEKRP